MISFNCEHRQRRGPSTRQTPRKAPPAKKPIRLQRPSENLEFIAPDGEVIKTSSSVVVALYGVRMTDFYLLKSAKGTLYLQSESLDSEQSRIKLMTRNEAVAFWNMSTSKLPASAMLHWVRQR